MRTKQLIYFASFVLVFGMFTGPIPVSSAQTIYPVVRGGTSTNTPPVVAPNTLGEDELCCVDCTHQYNEIPSNLLGAEYVMVANDDKTQADYTLEVGLNPKIGCCCHIRLYLFLDNRLGHHDIPGHDPLLNPDLIAAGMEWVYSLGFVDTGWNIGIDEQGNGDIDQWSSLYAMDPCSHTITLLQQNDATNPGGRNMYSIAAIHVPNPYPCDRYPYDGSVDVPIDVNLAWVRGGRAVQEEVYFGTDPNALPLVATILNLPSFPPRWDPPGDLIASKTYYWQIVEVNDPDRWPSNVWEFTTVRGEAQPEYPSDGALIKGDIVGGNISTKLEFFPGATTVEYTGYFSEDHSKVESRDPCAFLGQPPYAQWPDYKYTFWVGLPDVPPIIDSLDRGTKYYWTVDAEDAMGNIFDGDVWEFAIQGYYAFAPNPPNETTCIDTDVLLSWLPGYGVQDHEIYMGTSFEDVNNAVFDAFNPPPEFVDTTAEPNFMVTGLPKGVKQYWRVDQVVGRGPPYFIPSEFYKGDVWCFTVIPPDLNNDGIINFKDYAIPSNNLYMTGPNLLGDIDKDNVVNYKDLRILMEHWLWNL